MKLSRPSSIERLEPRIAPASVTVNAAAKTATWTDFDGDLITMKWTSTVAPSFISHDVGAGVMVDRIDLAPADHQNVALTITVKTAVGGDGFVDLGRLAGTGVVIKSLSAPKASFGEIDCGDTAKSIGALTIGSLGSISVDSFNNTLGDGYSQLSGVFTSLKINGDFGSGELHAGKSGEASGSIAITGSIRGDSGMAIGGSNGKLIFVGSKLASFTLGGSLVGGNMADDGYISLGGTVTSFTIKGSILGGTAANTGKLSLGNATKVTIGGSVIGGGGSQAGSIVSADLGTLTVGGSIIGGTATQTGYLSLDLVGKTTIGGSIVGGTATYAGGIATSGGKSFTLGGSIHGGTENLTGLAALSDTGTVVIKGGIFGHEATTATLTGSSAYLEVHKATSVSVLGGLHAGHRASGTPLNYNGAIFLTGNTGSVTIKGGITGHNGENAFLLAEGTVVGTSDFVAIGKLSITGDVSYATIATGHVRDEGGAAIGNAETPDAGLGSLTVTGNWIHSNLLVGVNDLGTTGANIADTHSTADATLLARVGLIKITGRILDDPQTFGYSGFEAERIAKLTVGGATVFQTGDATRYLDYKSYVIVREI